MAKTKTGNVPQSGIFGKLIAAMNKVQPGSSSTATNAETNVTLWIPSGSLPLDKTISNKLEEGVGGWPCGRIVEIYGEEATGKSTLGYQAMTNTQKLGGLVIFYDTENASSIDMMRACGVDTDQVVYSNMSILENVFDSMEENLKTIIQTPEFKDKPVFIMLDSLANLKTKQEEELGMDLNMNVALGKAKQLGHAWRKITDYLPKANACLYVVNQQRDKPGTMFGDPKTTTGGNALKYYASVRVKLLGKSPVNILDPYMQKQFDEAMNVYDDQMELYKLDKKNVDKPIKPKPTDFKGDMILVGFDTTARLVKNKVGPPHREAEFRLLFAKGVEDIHSWFEYALKFGGLEMEGKKYQIVAFPNDYGFFTRKEWELVMSDEEMYEKMKTFLTSNFVRSVVEIDSTTSSVGALDDDGDIDE